MGAIRKITSEQMSRFVVKDHNKLLMWHGISVSIRTLLPLKEVSQFVNSVMDCCYDKEHDIFVPDMMDFAFRVNVVSRYACIELPNDLEDQYSILYDTDIFDSVIKVINQAQISSIKNAINICMRNIT